MQGVAAATHLSEARKSVAVGPGPEIPARKISARSLQTEEARKLLPENVELLKRIGFLQGLVPTSRGGGEEICWIGFQAVRTDFVRVRIQRGVDIRRRWVFMRTVSRPSVSNCKIEVRVRRTSPLVCTSSAPVGKVRKVEGGYELSGRFPFSSGCEAYCGAGRLWDLRS